MIMGFIRLFVVFGSLSFIAYLIYKTIKTSSENNKKKKIRKHLEQLLEN